ncbi:kelch domain-containing protein [Plectosphaerella plurivora]|uniref:Kelch domain-containing protein n=1 Tax=Plectosphaerella plurivora TaxID=936078 RepID=A0A9P9AG08_9PEZI|nr:kelch domain-containing protein [Plectosphaerella plurivora]
MAVPILSRAIAATLFFFYLASAQVITSCPRSEGYYEAANGIKFTICGGTDYQGPTLTVINNIASAHACAALCSANTACQRAVYDRQTRVCHLKNEGGTLTWAVNTRFDSMRRNNNLPLGSFLSRCPAGESSYTSPNGVQFRRCENTDYVGPSASQTTGVTSLNACANICSTTTGCRKAVWDRVSNVCHAKAAEPAASLFWTTSTRFHVAYRPATLNPATLGQWSDLVRFSVIPVAAYVVPKFPVSDRLLYFSAWGNDAFSGNAGVTQFGDYNFVSGAKSNRQVANTQHDMFCPGISALEDGRILIQGGSDAAAVTVYDPATNAFTRDTNLVEPRGYQTSVTMSDGRVFTIGGAYSGPRRGKSGEIYDPRTKVWTPLPGADVAPMLTTDREGIWREDNHAWLFAWKNGSAFQAGPSMRQHWYGSSGSGTVQWAGTTRDTSHAMCGTFVMYDAVAGKIFSAGGSPDYTNSPALRTAHITTIGDPFSTASVERVADMAFPRGFGNAVVLHDGTIFVSGGQRRSLVFTNTDGILVPELFDPSTKTWTQLAPMAVPRNYHAVSILLSDGTVFSGGGGLCYLPTPLSSSAQCDKSVDHADGEIYRPPYLFNADGTAATRPTISNLEAETVRVGGTLRFNVAGVSGTARVALVRMGSVTHSVNSDQRRVPLADVTVASGRYTARLPSDSGVLVPGYYFLFVSSASGRKTPSIGRTVRISL